MSPGRTFFGPSFGLDLNTCLLLGVGEGLKVSYAPTIFTERYIFPMKLD